MAEAIRQAVEQAGVTTDGRGIELEGAGNASAALQMTPLGAGAGQSLAQRVYAVVAPFATVRDDVTLDELKARWAGAGKGPLLIPQDSAAALSTIFGSLNVGAVADADLRGTAPGSGSRRRPGDCTLRPT